MRNKLKVTVVGSGYVGMSLAVLLAQQNDVVLLDVDQERVNKINNKKSTISDNEIDDYLLKKELSLVATTDKKSAFRYANFILVATPTDYDEITNGFNTSSVDEVVKEASNLNKDALIIIKSTIPLGHTKFLQKLHKNESIIFSPEFLREGNALKDNLYPSRIVVGSNLKKGKHFAKLLSEGAKEKNIKTLFVSSTEAEAIKLFSNTYLAMRVSFFNELDSFAMIHELDTRNIIDGVSLDKRIGTGYNNPSFGYGGYCLPKDAKQLLANYDLVPQALIEAIVTSNKTRKEFISKEILKLKPKTIGIYLLEMKSGSDNFRSSAIIDIIKRIKTSKSNLVIYEPKLDSEEFLGIKVTNNFDEFKEISDLIISNRMSKNLKSVKHKCFTRDLFGNDW